ncbi:MAG: hypothetical protein EBZ48_05390 [Proteobacteria bacterium]|nr:hypothetical protein [Pseudomonadota bacterium]
MQERIRVTTEKAALARAEFLAEYPVTEDQMLDMQRFLQKMTSDVRSFGGILERISNDPDLTFAEAAAEVYKLGVTVGQSNSIAHSLETRLRAPALLSRILEPLAITAPSEETAESTEETSSRLSREEKTLARSCFKDLGFAKNAVAAALTALKDINAVDEYSAAIRRHPNVEQMIKLLTEKYSERCKSPADFEALLKEHDEMGQECILQVIFPPDYKSLEELKTAVESAKSTRRPYLHPASSTPTPQTEAESILATISAELAAVPDLHDSAKLLTNILFHGFYWRSTLYSGTIVVKSEFIRRNCISKNKALFDTLPVRDFDRALHTLYQHDLLTRHGKGHLAYSIANNPGDLKKTRPHEGKALEVLLNYYRSLRPTG